jgi:hypothetical protein
MSGLVPETRWKQVGSRGRTRSQEDFDKLILPETLCVFISFVALFKFSFLSIECRFSFR